MGPADTSRSSARSGALTPLAGALRSHEVCQNPPRGYYEVLNPNIWNGGGGDSKSNLSYVIII